MIVLMPSRKSEKGSVLFGWLWKLPVIKRAVDLPVETVDGCDGCDGSILLQQHNRMEHTE
jgi:hypothetical protein